MCLLPFIDEARLLAAVAPCEASLTAEERFRNAKRCEQLFLVQLSPAHPPPPFPGHGVLHQFQALRAAGSGAADPPPSPPNYAGALPYS